MSDDADHLVEVTLHDGRLEAIEVSDAARRLVVDVPFVRMHHGRDPSHRYWLTCDGVTSERTARWRAPETPRPPATEGERATERAAREEAWAALGSFEPVPRAAVLPMWIVSASLTEAGGTTTLRLEGSVDRPYAWCVVELTATRIALSESDGTLHDARSFAALGGAYWDAAAARHGNRSSG